MTCVGGPSNGRAVWVDDGLPYFRVVNPLPPIGMVKPKADASAVNAEIHTTNYKVELLHTTERTIRYLIPSSWTGDDAIRHMLRCVREVGEKGLDVSA
jgi:hypothetical protein